MKKRTLSILALVLVLVMALCACAPKTTTPPATGTDTPSGEQPASSDPAAEQPAGNEAPAKDTLTISMPVDLDTLDTLNPTAVGILMNDGIFDRLLHVGQDGTVQPSVAESWEISDDKLTVTFKLRAGVTFHNGDPVTADDVVYSFMRLINSPYMGALKPILEKMEKVDDSTVALKLFVPYAPILEYVSNLKFGIVSQKAVEATGGAITVESAIGCGPYKLTSWVSGEKTVQEAYEGYWRGVASIKTVTWLVQPDRTSAAIALEKGEVDATYGFSDGDRDRYAAGTTVSAIEQPVEIFLSAFINTTRKPFDDVRVRQAMAYAMDKEEIIMGVTTSEGIKPASALVTEASPYYDAAMQGLTPDLEKAKALLAEAGLKDLKLKMITYTNPRPYNPATGTKLATAVQGYLSKIGVTATIEQFDWTTYKEKVSQGEGDISFYGWNGDNGDPDNFMNLLADKDPTMNIAMYNNEKYNELIKKALALPNGPERDKLYNEMEDIVNKEAVWLPISHSTQMAAYGANVTGFSVHPTGNIFFQGVSIS